jgi:ankyrin repeat protein
MMLNAKKTDQVKMLLHRNTVEKPMTNFMYSACATLPDAFVDIVPKTDDFRMLSKYCLVCKPWAEFLLRSEQGRKIWWAAALSATGYNHPLSFDLRCLDFWTQLKCFVCPWLQPGVSLPVDLHYPERSPNYEIRLIKNGAVNMGKYTPYFYVTAFNDHTESSGGESDNDDDPMTVAVSVKPPTNPEEGETVQHYLPEDFPDPPTAEVDDELASAVDEMLPACDGEQTTLRTIHRTAFAILAFHDEWHGSIHIMSSRDRQQPRHLRQIFAPGMDNYKTSDLSSCPFHVVYVYTGGIITMGPRPEPRTLLCDGEDSKVGRAAPALWMAHNGDAVGAIRFLKKELEVDVGLPGLHYKKTVLHYAVYGNQPAALQTLISAKADVDQSDANGVSPLTLAVLCARVQCVQVLCNNRATVNTRTKKTPINCIGRGTPDTIIQILDLLFAAGGNPNEILDETGQTLLFRGSLIKSQQILRYLVGNKANPRHLDDMGNTMLHVCCNEVGEEVLHTIVRGLGVDINARNNQGHTALHKNIRALSVKTARFMIEELGASPKVQDNDGATVLDYFTSDNRPYHRANSYQEKIDLLLSH